MDHSKKHYYRARLIGGLYFGNIFHYDRIINVFDCNEGRDTPEEAEDDIAQQHIENSKIEETVGEITPGS